MSTRWGGAARSFAAGAAFLAFVVSTTVAAYAATSTIEVGDQAVVRVFGRNNTDIVVRTWERSAVQIDTDDEQIQVNRRSEAFGTTQNPMSAAIPVQTIRVRDPAGNLATATLPPEDFPFAADMRTGLHDVVQILTGDNSRTTVTIPAGTSLVDARINGSGNLTVSNYHGGTLFVRQNAGRAKLENVAAATFVQVLNGRFVALDSSFDRLRARGNTAAMLFERCRAKQIEVTTHGGPIVYDNGSFDPGLARFDSANGLIAIGVAGNATVTGRTQTGHVLAMFDQRPRLEQHTEGEATATIGIGGATVNAVTGRGNVFLYDGALGARRAVPPEWRALHNALLRQTVAERPAVERPLNRPLFRLRN